MNLRQCVLDSLRNGSPIQNIASHYSISERDILQIVANEMGAKIPEHLVEYLKLQDMEALWAEHACHASMPPPEAWNMLHTQRERFHLAMEKEIRRVSGVNSHPEIRPMVEAFQKAFDCVVNNVTAPSPSPSKLQKRNRKKK